MVPYRWIPRPSGASLFKDKCDANPFFAAPHMIGDDSDGVFEPHDLTHALDGFGCLVIHALHFHKYIADVLRSRREIWDSDVGHAVASA